jgi:hypothetical protein
MMMRESSGVDISSDFPDALIVTVEISAFADGVPSRQTAIPQLAAEIEIEGNMPAVARIQAITDLRRDTGRWSFILGCLFLNRQHCAQGDSPTLTEKAPDVHPFHPPEDVEWFQEVRLSESGER